MRIQTLLTAIILIIDEQQQYNMYNNIIHMIAPEEMGEKNTEKTHTEPFVDTAGYSIHARVDKNMIFIEKSISPDYNGDDSKTFCGRCGFGISIKYNITQVGIVQKLIIRTISITATV
ncbi:hypothetical protein QTP88_018355 [Uroleucon formosanum]